MNIKRFSMTAVVLCACALGARAQSIEEQAGEISAFKARAAQIQVNAAYAKSIVCSHLPEAAEMGDSIRLYTRLDGVGPRESLPEEGKGSASVSADKKATKDETKLDDYGSQSATRSKLHIDAWSCDTQDYFLTFDMDGLVRSSQSVQSQAVKGRARVETRGQTDFDGDISCTAFW